MKTIMENGLKLPEKLKSSELTCTSEPTQSLTYNQSVIAENSTGINQESGEIISMNDLKIPQYQKLSVNNAKLTKAHSNFFRS